VADLFVERRQVGFIGENLDNFSTRQRYEAFHRPYVGMAVSRALLRRRRLSGGLSPPGSCLLRIRSCRRCSAPPICWRSARWTACGRTTPPPLPAIVGFDDIPQADWQPYQLTTVQQNTALLAHHAVDLLVTRIARFSLPSRHREVPVKLIIRHSAK
jgi:DNA-binding LacI/PurR family transcriptional regulator